jgi:hypothetical protein
MTCRKAFDLDLVACLLDAGRPEWMEFREHYPRCPDCAAEVRTWSELQGGLGTPHPSANDLVRYESRANDMEPEARKAVAAHIATCRACRDELRALRAFDPRTVAAAGPAPSRPARRWWSPARVVLHPAFAYGLALALAFPLLAPRLRVLVERRTELPAPRGAGGAGEPAASDRLSQGLEVQPPATEPPAAPPTRSAGARPMAKAAAPAAEGIAMRQEAASGAGDDWPVVVLTPAREVAVPLPPQGLIVRVAPPRSQPAIPPGLGWLRVRDAAGRRELREQQFGAPGSNAEIRVPAAWLELGSYRVDLVLGDDSRPVATTRFRIER